TRRSSDLNSQVVWFTLRYDSAKSGTRLRSASRSSSPSKRLFASTVAGASWWFMGSSVVGSTPCATTTVPTGPPQARETAWGVAARAIRTSNRSHDIGVSPSYPWLYQSGACAGSASSDSAYRGRRPVMVPESGVASPAHLRRAEQHRRRDCHTECPRGLEIDDQLE